MHAYSPNSSFYKASSDTPTFVDIQPLMYQLITGQGPREGQLFQEASQTIYRVAAALQSLSVANNGARPSAMPLEAIWKLDDHGQRSQDWILMMAQPGEISNAMYEEAVSSAQTAHPLPAEHLLRFEFFIEGYSAQLLHSGPYANLEHSQRKLIDFIEDHGYVTGHDVHDIYLNDALKTPPAGLQTIIRMPAWKD